MGQSAGKDIASLDCLAQIKRLYKLRAHRTLVHSIITYEQQLTVQKYGFRSHEILGHKRKHGVTDYKKHNTIKYLVANAPNGTFSYRQKDGVGAPPIDMWC